MAIEVEDGTAKANSNAYDTAANANTYYTDMGYSDTATDATMIRGSRPLDRHYRDVLKGEKATSGQAMAWPRSNATDEDGNTIDSSTIPTLWKHATYEMARTVDTNVAASEPQRIKSAGAGSARVEFATALEVDSILGHVRGLVSPFLKRSNRVVRA